MTLRLVTHAIARRLALVLALGAISRPVVADDDLELREQTALQAAVERVTPSVVSIETVGGLERVERVLVGNGPTTGLIVSPDGYIVSSAFNFVQKPSSTIVTLADGTRLPAQLVATDRSRMLVLLKIEPGRVLPVPEAAPENEVRVGWWSIAIGRAFDPARPNVSVGIVSAVGRLSGRAIQTDAKVSPSNYGGPLVDIRGRVMGVLSPLSPQKSGEVSGVEWYDSGIGFAVPLEHVNRVLPRLKEGVDLKPGLVGISLQSGDLYADAPVIAAARPNSPAYRTGLKPGDKIVAVDERNIARTSQLLDEVNRRYAGDKVTLTLLRGDERLTREIELVDHLDPYQRAFLGILPQRTGKQAEAGGAVVRYVYADSPAAQASLQIGDVITALAEKPVKSANELVEIMAAAEVGKPAPIEIRRGDEALHFELTWQAEPEAVPAELPAAPVLEGQPEAGPATGRFSVKVPELKNEALAYVPEDYDSRRSYALVVWTHPPSEIPADDSLLAVWKDRCDRGGLILLVPKAAEGGKWQSDDFEFIRKSVEQLRATYQIDPLRIVAWGDELGGSVACALAFNQRETVRGVVALRSRLAQAPVDNDPVSRLDFFLTQTKGSRFEKATAATIETLRERKFAVTVKEQGENAQLLSDDELAEALRWIDSLDKI
ncbi:MAG TPA: PDZ domain-containing protein [Pirellulales bacterium]|nr:PDZ domain-containing protein [Pirellulales bacterium]